MFKNIIFAIVATAGIGAATIGAAEARDSNHHRHNRSNVIIQFGGFGDSGYNNQFDRDYGYRNNYYDDYGYGRRHRFNQRYYDGYEPYCGTITIKVKKWNRSHTRYSLVKRRVKNC